MRAPFFSIVMPVLNGGRAFEQCLDAVARSGFRDWELIVVDDGSSDASVELAARHGARVLATKGRQGPAAARNLGSEAAVGRFLFFLDADCEVHPDTLERAARHLEADPDLDALFGSYDLSPAATGLVSQFKNLLHHFVHQSGEEQATTFWAGCGVVRRETFLRLGGFDAGRFPRPSIEDIELGYRMT
ncbi:MAG: glycosyltransferase family A protein, partial [Acidobacteria bacterium]|nr:glycosyltransferase family A protein [Acidobacteriota bacterium]